MNFSTFNILGRIIFNHVSFSQIFWAIGAVFEVALALVVMPTLGWQYLLVLSSLPVLIFVILCRVGLFTFFQKIVSSIHQERACKFQIPHKKNERKLK